MSGAEIQNLLEQTLFALARSVGVGVDFMEPIVLMGKLRVHTTPEHDDVYYWRQTPLLRVRREKDREDTVWLFLSPDGALLSRHVQEKTFRQGA